MTSIEIKLKLKAINFLIKLTRSITFQGYLHCAVSSQAYSEPFQISTMERFAKIFPPFNFILKKMKVSNAFSYTFTFPQKGS